MWQIQNYLSWNVPNQNSVSKWIVSSIKTLLPFCPVYQDNLWRSKTKRCARVVCPGVPSWSHPGSRGTTWFIEGSLSTKNCVKWAAFDSDQILIQMVGPPLGRSSGRWLMRLLQWTTQNTAPPPTFSPRPAMVLGMEITDSVFLIYIGCIICIYFWSEARNLKERWCQTIPGPSGQ